MSHPSTSNSEMKILTQLIEIINSGITVILIHISFDKSKSKRNQSLLFKIHTSEEAGIIKVCAEAAGVVELQAQAANS